MKFSVYIAMSLDGFIAKPDGDIDWLMNYNPPEEDSQNSFKDFLNSVDVMVMGRKTFEKVQTFGLWPYEGIRVIVLTKTLNSIPHGYNDKIELFNGSINDIASTLTKDGYKRAYVDGGTTIQSFLQRELITDMCITIIPILLGAGIPLFSNLEDSQEWELISTTPYSTGMLTLHYNRTKKE